MKTILMIGVASVAMVAAQARAQTVPSTEQSTQQTDAPATAEIAGDDADPSQDIIVTGIRASLRSAAAIKRNANAIVDAVTATDVGKFPDNNISESLQRISGVAIDRNGGEGQFITVRGLGPEFNTVLVNGRIMATDNPGREFSFDVLSPNMIQRTEVYKSAVPQLQEGGIGATVNIVTAKPFDQRTGFHGAVAVSGIYDDLRDKLSPDLSGVLSWTNPDKTFGAVLSASYTNRRSQNDQYIVHGWLPGSTQTVNGQTGTQLTIVGSPTSTGLTPAALRPITATAPRDSTYYRYQDRRERLNVAGSVQAALGDRMVLTVDGIYSKFDVTSRGNTFGVFYVEPFINPTVNANGTMTSFNRPGTQFQAANPGLGTAGFASQNDNYGVANDRFTSSYQIGGNLAWTATDALTVKFDASLTEARNRTPSAFVVVGALAQTAPRWELNAGNDIPTISNLGNITDPSLQRLHYSTIAVGRVTDKGSEFHADGEWKADRGLLRSINFGAAYNQRRKISRTANNDDTLCSYCGYDVPAPVALLTPYTLDNWLTKASGSETAPRNFLQFDPYAILAYMSRPDVLAVARQGRTAAEQAAVAREQAALAGGAFAPRDRPGALLNVQEKVTAAYVSANLGGDDWSANIGARFVDTRVVTQGFGQTVRSVTLDNPNDDFYTITLNDPAPLRIGNHYTNFLPSANLKYDLTDNMLLRFAASKTVTRPTLTSLGTNNFYQGRKSAATSGGGNPGLKPFKSTNYDISYEWYVSDLSYVSLTGFYKEFSDFLETQTLPVTIQNITFQDTRTRNGAKGSIAGFEVGGQYSLDRIGGPLSGFGVAGNYTYVSSTAERTATSNTTCGYNGLSPHSANGSVFYEKFGIQSRLSYNWRSSFLRSCFSDYGQPESRRAYGQLDFSASYDITPNVQVFAQGVNLTDAYIYDYSILEERMKLVQDTGRRIIFGVRGKF